MDIPDAIMFKLRGRRGLASDDTSEDKKIMAMTPVDMVKECCAWEFGDPAWADMIAGWMVNVGASPHDF